MIDRSLFIAINDLASQNIWLDRLGIFFAEYVGYVLLAVLAYLLFFKRSQTNKLMVLTALISAAVSRGIITEAIRFFYHRPRPFLVMSANQLIQENHFAFPSGHAAFYFAISTAVYFYNKKLGTVFFLVSLLMGLARIYAGVHWPSDILGGLLIGIAVAWATNYYLSKRLKI